MSELRKHIEAMNAKTQAWVDEDPDNRFAGMLVADPAHWAEYDIHTPAELDHYLLATDCYELHKSAYGFKPNWSRYKDMTMAELEAELESLGRAAEEEANREKARQEASVAEFEDKITELMAMGAKDRETAVRWLRDTGDDQEKYDDGYFEYCNGLPYGYLSGNINPLYA